MLGLVAVSLLAVWPAAGQTVIDGDSLQIGAVRYRLNGIDAPEVDQVCPDGWPAGFEARRYLEQLVEGKQIRCGGHPNGTCPDATRDWQAGRLRSFLEHEIEFALHIGPLERFSKAPDPGIGNEMRHDESDIDTVEPPRTVH